MKLKKGQSLLELLVAVAIGVILIGGSVSLMEISLKTYNSTKKNLQANVLLREAAQVIHSSVVSDWHNIYGLNKGADYKISLSGATWIISAGQEEGAEEKYEALGKKRDSAQHERHRSRRST